MINKLSQISVLCLLFHLRTATCELGTSMRFLQVFIKQSHTVFDQFINGIMACGNATCLATEIMVACQLEVISVHVVSILLLTDSARFEEEACCLHSLIWREIGGIAPCIMKIECCTIFTLILRSLQGLSLGENIFLDLWLVKAKN